MRKAVSRFGAYNVCLFHLTTSYLSLLFVYAEKRSG